MEISNLDRLYMRKKMVLKLGSAVFHRIAMGQFVDILGNDQLLPKYDGGMYDNCS